MGPWVPAAGSSWGSPILLLSQWVTGPRERGLWDPWFPQGHHHGHDQQETNSEHLLGAKHNLLTSYHPQALTHEKTEPQIS